MTRDHGGGLDVAIAQYGGHRSEWLDLSTGINPVSFPIPEIPAHIWRDLPDVSPQNALLSAAREFWNVPDEASIIAASGVSQLISAIPGLLPAGQVAIPGPTYNEHAASFLNFGWEVCEAADVKVVVHPNNPDGKFNDLISQADKYRLLIIDESFCDTVPEVSQIELVARPNVLLLKGLGKFWGLGGLRLGFAMGSADLIGTLTQRIGPWAVSGPAQIIGAAALSDQEWANTARARLDRDSARLDLLMRNCGFPVIGGTSLFRLYDTANAATFQSQLADKYIWSRIFPYSKRWVRLGLPGAKSEWQQLETALAGDA